ncbi:transcriptional regulator [Rossellomorea marisflavi]|jgi:putative transcriptional regulator|uniref:helix-turn-helix transcriptional regulator n=1 Tax=Rossellomorea marisflavi TaxID=189381 RepID=UPI0025CB0701|nr:helix-turn-helix transcriptional regulator [Rossellomorea marisflavi]MDR4937786.1 helix-turn-helix transcriptional regulator [Rossellomorea marisflavi]GLI83885.1 transcriptional regulator [Rossellomorea marisflavi]
MKNKLVEYRKSQGLSQEKLALKLGVSRQTIISIEKGKYDPSLQLAFQLAEVFHVSIEELFLYENQKGD